MEFVAIIDRIKEETDLKNLSQIADFVGTTQSHMSRKKKKNEFDANWAVTISMRYDLSIHWILFGEEPRHIDDLLYDPDFDYDIINYIRQWIDENMENNKFFEGWFAFELGKRFPEYQEWWSKKNED